MIIKLGYEPNIIFFSRNGPMFFYSFYREILKQNKSLKIKPANIAPSDNSINGINITNGDS